MELVEPGAQVGDQRSAGASAEGRRGVAVARQRCGAALFGEQVDRRARCNRRPPDEVGSSGCGGQPAILVDHQDSALRGRRRSRAAPIRSPSGPAKRISSEVGPARSPEALVAFVAARGRRCAAVSSRRGRRWWCGRGDGGRGDDRIGRVVVAAARGQHRRSCRRGDTEQQQSAQALRDDRTGRRRSRGRSRWPGSRRVPSRACVGRVVAVVLAMGIRRTCRNRLMPFVGR